MWLFTVSHRCLLLRATPRGPEESRIDVLFKPVSYVAVPTVLPALTITATSAQEWADDHPVRPPRSVRDDECVYRLDWPGGIGCVVSMGAWVHEDDGDYASESHFQGAFQVVPGFFAP